MGLIQLMYHRMFMNMPITAYSTDCIVVLPVDLLPLGTSQATEWDPLV